MEYAIKVKNLTKVYKLYEKPIDRLKESLNPFGKKYHKDFYALKNVSFEVKKGETVGIIGKNGAGKSTLLKIITGVLTPTSGSVEVNGKIASLLELGAGFNPEMTGLENVYLQGTIMGFSKEEIDKKIDDILSFADIGEFIYQPVKTYSSGMFARLAFATAINVEPDILIIDEALSVGDIFFQQKCNLFMKKKMLYTTKLIVTHDLATLANMVDRAILIDNGKKIIEGKPLDVIELYQKLLHSSLFKSSIQIEKTEYVNNIVKKSQTIEEVTMKDIPKEKLSGTLEVEIKKISLGTENNTLNPEHIYPNEKLFLNVIIETKKDVEKLIVGYIIKDKYGNNIFGENTLTSGLMTDKLEKGKKYYISYTIYWPEIQEGDYFLTIGFGEGDDPLYHKILCWSHNIYKLKSVIRSNEIVHCLFNNKIKEIFFKELQ